MNKDALAISDRYKTTINPVFILQESFSDLYKRNAIAELQEWYAYDVEVLNNILIQEGLGDMIKNVGQKIGGAVKGVGDFAMKKLATALGKLLKMAIPSEEEAQKLQQEVERLKTDQSYLEQQAAAGNKLLGGGSADESSEEDEEMYESTRQFILSTVFSESNLIELFHTQLLSEATKKAGRPKGSKEGKAKPAQKPSGKLNVAGGVQKANMAALDPAIMELISVVQQMKGGRQKQALNRIARTIAKKTKLNFPLPYPKADKQAGQETQQPQAAGQDNQLATTGSGSQLATTGGNNELATTGGQELATTGQDNQLARKPNFRRRTGPEIVDAEYTDVPADKALPSSGGDTKSLFQKIMGYIKAHPRITSAVALGLIAAVTAASGGALLPLVVSGLTTGGVKAGVAAYQSNKQDGKVNWDKTVDALFTGTAQGAGAAAVGQAAKGVMGAFGGDSGIQPTQPQAANTGALDNWDGQNDTTNHGGIGNWDGQEAEAGASVASTEVSDDLFKQYNKSPYNPSSPLDQAKKQIMQKLSDANNGQIPASKYNDLASKAAQLLKQGKKSSAVVSQLFPESYTASYLRYF